MKINLQIQQTQWLVYGDKLHYEVTNDKINFVMDFNYLKTTYTIAF